MLSMKADANRKRIYKTRQQRFYLVSLLSSKNKFSLTREVNLKIKEFNCQKADLRAIHTENVPTRSFRGAA